ncbi:MAG TPA: AI-2E family transporter [Solirubrobacterales bacterium]|jgi:predicted PurR-regulated permease PerM|nr:AI-2E family transporter [Solirubrobacterales bacterium]
MTPRRAIRGRLWRSGRGSAAPEEEVVEIDPAELAGIFSAPTWLRDLGFSAWLLVGVGTALVGAIFLLAETQTIVMPVATAAIVASVTAPLVGWLKRHGVPRGAGAAIVFLGIVLIGVGVGVIVMGGIASQADSLSEKLHAGADEIESLVRDLGVATSTAADANQHASASISAGFKALTDGLLGSVDKLASLAVFLSFTAISLFFMLKDAPTLGRFVERHLGMPLLLAHTVLAQVSRSLRGYFVGVTIVAAWSAVLVGAGALLLGVPLAGTIAVVTFVGGYIPYLGAWAAGVFAVLIALGGQGPEAALAIAVIVLLANGVLQQLVQPIAYGAALDLHPLAVLIVTIAGGCLFGTIGLILAAPLVSAAARISAELTASRSSAEQAEPVPPSPAQ